MKLKFLMLDCARACNQRCTHCTNWKCGPSKVLTQTQHEAIIYEFSEIAEPGAALVPCGGEPLLGWKRFVDTCSYARECGLRVLSVTNGTLVTNDLAKILVERGPHEISISFDHFEEQHHDTLRGEPGAFRKAIRGVEILNDARRGSDTKLYCMGLIHAGNYERIDEFYRFAIETLKVDKLKLNFAQPSFGMVRGDDFWFESQSINPDILDEVLDKCVREFGIQFNPRWRSAVRIYATALYGMTSEQRRAGWCSGIELSESICNAWERNIHVGMAGELRLCWKPQFWTRQWPGTSLKEFVKLASEWDYSNCKRLCGISHSVRRESTYQIVKHCEDC